MSLIGWLNATLDKLSFSLESFDEKSAKSEASLFTGTEIKIGGVVWLGTNSATFVTTQLFKVNNGQGPAISGPGKIGFMPQRLACNYPIRLPQY